MGNLPTERNGGQAHQQGDAVDRQFVSAVTGLSTKPLKISFVDMKLLNVMSLKRFKKTG